MKEYFHKMENDGYQISAICQRYEDVHGLSSFVSPNEHVLFLDFDKCKLDKIITYMEAMVVHFKLSSAHIFSTGRPDSYHVYVFDTKKFREWFSAICFNESIDTDWLANCFKRQEFILRFSDKGGRSFRKVHTVYGEKQADCQPQDLCHFISYRTFSRVQKVT